MEVVIRPANPDVYLYSNGRSLGVDMEVRMLVVSEALVVMVAMVVLVVTLVKVVMLVMVVTVSVPSHLLDSIYMD